MPRLALMAGLLLASTDFALAELPPGNLIVNGGAADALTPSWTVLASGGSGWTREGLGGADPDPGFFVTSYGQCRRSQTVDLLALGVTAPEMDGGDPPDIKVSEFISSYVGNGNNGADTYYIRVELRGEGGQVIDSWLQGSATAPVAAPTSWVEMTHTFKDYAPGVRTIYFEDGGFDTGQWQGPYGTYHDGVRVEFSQDSDGDGLPDVWEIANGTNPNLDDSFDDKDLDGLLNYDEYLAGTIGNDPDSDDDGLKDGFENLSGVWAGSEATGTDPLNSDTDGDGLADGLENPDLSYTGATRPGSDPNLVDSDGDGYQDGLEIEKGSNPANAASLPDFNYGTYLTENFDGGSSSSTYVVTRSTGNYTPSVIESGLASNGKLLRLTTQGTGSSKTSIAFDSIPSNAQTVKLTFDFRVIGDADGFGIGLFKNSRYGAAGGVNPGTGTVNWEDPTASSGFPEAIVFGFGVYNSNFIRMTGPDSTAALFQVTPAFQLKASPAFHRAMITAKANGSGGTLISMEIIPNINGTNPTPVTIATNVLVTNFDVSTEPFRLIAGGRTGGLTVTSELDNISLAAVSATVPAPRIVSSVMNRSTSPATFDITWTSQTGAFYTLESSTTLVTWASVQAAIPAAGGATTTYKVPVPAGAPAKNFFRVKTQ